LDVDHSQSEVEHRARREPAAGTGYRPVQRFTQFEVNAMNQLGLRDTLRC
jgi:hypothetical protein